MCSLRSCGESSLKSCLNSFKSWPKSGLKSSVESCAKPCLKSLLKSRLMSSMRCWATPFLKFRAKSCLVTPHDHLVKSIS